MLFNSKQKRKKRSLILLGLIVVLVIAILAVLYLRNIEKPCDALLEVHSSNNYSVQVNGDYYYLNDNKVCKASDSESKDTVIYECTGLPIQLFADGDDIYAYSSNGTLVCINTTAASHKTFDVCKNAGSFVVADNYIIMCLYDNEQRPIVYDKYTCQPASMNFDDKISFDENNSISYSVKEFADSKQILLYGIRYYQLLLYDKCGNVVYNSSEALPTYDPLVITDTAIMYVATYNREYQLKSKDRDTGEVTNSALISNEYAMYSYSVCSDNSIMLMGQKTIHNSTDLNELIKHESDCLFKYDTKTLEKTFEHKTRKYERIIYADSEKAITYYDGEYLTYSLEDCKVIDKQNADEIKDGGSYFFEACGEYLFVFDDKTDKLINKIKV